MDTLTVETRCGHLYLYKVHCEDMPTSTIVNDSQLGVRNPKNQKIRESRLKRYRQLAEKEEPITILKDSVYE